MARTQWRQTDLLPPAMAVALVVEMLQMAHLCGKLHRAGLRNILPWHRG